MTITRAKDELFLCYPASRRARDGSTTYFPPSRFIKELPDDLLRHAAFGNLARYFTTQLFGQLINRDLVPGLTQLPGHRNSGRPTANDRDFLVAFGRKIGQLGLQDRLAQQGDIHRCQG